MRSSSVFAALLLVGSLALGAGPVGAEPLVGPAVGNADLLNAEGSRLYNEKKYAPARDNFLKAARITPHALPVYLSLARSYFALKDLELACQSYRVYLKSAVDSPDRVKAQSESDLCERQLAAKNRGASALGTQYVALKAQFFEALDKGSLLGADSARARLEALLGAHYVGPDLGDMGTKLARAAEGRADVIYTAATTGTNKRAPAELLQAAELYQLALDTGTAPTHHEARMGFMRGLAFLLDGKPKLAEAAFAEVTQRESGNSEARFFHGLAVYVSGDRPRALKHLESDLPNDPRTGLLKAASAFDQGADASAVELQRILFARRFGSPRR